MKIIFNNIEYEINENKLLCVLNILNGSMVKSCDIEKFMEKFKLFDEYFLKNINKI